MGSTKFGTMKTFQMYTLVVALLVAQASGEEAPACAEGCAEKYTKCGGKGLKPDFKQCCDDDFQCVYFSQHYSQCRPKSWRLPRTENAKVVECSDGNNGGGDGGSGGAGGQYDDCPTSQAAWNGLFIFPPPPTVVQDCNGEAIRPGGACYDPDYEPVRFRPQCWNACFKNPDCFAYLETEFDGCLLLGKDGWGKSIRVEPDVTYGINFIKCFSPDPFCPSNTVKKVSADAQQFVQLVEDLADWGPVTLSVRPGDGGDALADCASICRTATPDLFDVGRKQCVAFALGPDPFQGSITPRPGQERRECILLFEDAGRFGVPFPNNEQDIQDYSVYSISDCFK